MMKQIAASAALVVFLSLALTPTFAVADSTTNQSISANMNGFAFTNAGCCPDVSSSIHGKITTDADGEIILSQQSGSIAIGSTTYQFELIPSDKTIK